MEKHFLSPKICQRSRAQKRHSYCQGEKSQLNTIINLFLSLFHVQAMPNRCCDWLNKKCHTPREGDFGSDWDSSSGGDSVFLISAIASVSFRYNDFTIRCPSPIPVWKMPAPGHGESDSSRISTSTRLTDACITRPAKDLIYQFPIQKLTRLQVAWLHQT